MWRYNKDKERKKQENREKNKPKPLTPWQEAVRRANTARLWRERDPLG